MTLGQKILQLQFGKTQQIEFLDAFFRLIEDGITFKDALTLMRHTSDATSKEVTRGMLRSMREGRSISAGMRDWFSPVIVGAIAAAEKSDDFASLGRQLVQQQRDQKSALGVLFGQIGAPLLYVVMGMALVAYFTLSVFPQFDNVVPAAHWDALPRNTYAFGRAIVGYWYLFVGLPVAVVVGFMFIFARWAGKMRVVADRVWPFSFYRRLSSARVMEALGLMVTAGHDFRTGLRVVQRNATPHQRLYMSRMSRRLREGRSIPMTMDVNFFPENEMMHLRMLAEYHGLNEVMIRTGATMRENVMKGLEKMGMPIRTFCYLLVAGLYISLILSIYTVSGNMQNSITPGAG